MVTITTVFTGDYNEVKAQMGEYIDLLFALAKGGNSTATERVNKVEEVTEAYYDKLERHAASNELERLASLILYEELTDNTPYKTKNTEYPIESERQKLDYYNGLTMRKVPDTIGMDGNDHRLPTRKHF